MFTEEILHKFVWLASTFDESSSHFHTINKAVTSYRDCSKIPEIGVGWLRQPLGNKNRWKWFAIEKPDVPPIMPVE